MRCSLGETGSNMSSLPSPQKQGKPLRNSTSNALARWFCRFWSHCLLAFVHFLSQKFYVQNASAGCFSYVLLGFSFVLISVCQMALSRAADAKRPIKRKPCSYVVAVFVAAICRSAERHAFGCPTRRQNKLVYVQNIRIKAYRNTNKFVSRSDEFTASFAHLGQNVCVPNGLVWVIFPPVPSFFPQAELPVGGAGVFYMAVPDGRAR